MQSIESINTTRRFILRILANKEIHMNETNEMKKIKPIHKRINGSSMNILMAATYTRKIIIIVIISSTTTITTTSTTKQYIYIVLVKYVIINSVCFTSFYSFSTLFFSPLASQSPPENTSHYILIVKFFFGIIVLKCTKKHAKNEILKEKVSKILLLIFICIQYAKSI